MKSRFTMAMRQRLVAQTFLSADSGDFPVASHGEIRNTRQECLVNSQTRMSALHVWVLIVFTLFLLTGHAAETKTLYTCGMHPQVIQDHPGNCPICGMTLTPVRKQAGTKAPATGRKVNHYKSTMNPGEVSPGPAKDSMGMDMVPVYEDETAAAESSVITIDPATTQNMGLRIGVVTRG